MTKEHAAASSDESALSELAAAALPRYEGFWDGCRVGELRFPRCPGCGRFVWYPKERCPSCGERPEWAAIEGTGELYSWTVVRHQFDPDHPVKPPYVVALVVFADAPGVRLVTTLEVADLARLTCGTPVQPVFRDGRVEFTSHTHGQ